MRLGRARPWIVPQATAPVAGGFRWGQEVRSLLLAGLHSERSAHVCSHVLKGSNQAQFER